MNSTPSFSPDDLPPEQFMPPDRLLQRQLEDTIARRFYEACDGVTQSLLTGCEWYVRTHSSQLILVINCPDMSTNWRVLNNLLLLAAPLELFSNTGRVRICPPVGEGEPLDIRIDEIPVFRDLL
jgi:hypothetical protein